MSCQAEEEPTTRAPRPGSVDDRLPTLIVQYKATAPALTPGAVNRRFVSADARLTGAMTTRGGGASSTSRVKKTERVHPTQPKLFTVDTTDVAAAEALLAEATADPNVEYASIARKVYALAMPAECGTTACTATNYYGFSRCGVTPLWARLPSFGGTAKKIAVIDTGVMRTHVELAPFLDLANSQSCVGSPCTLNAGADDNGHGTHCSGTITAKHGSAGTPIGVATNSKLVACKFLDSTGSGSSAGAVRCIYAMIAAGVSVMSNSWGGGYSSEIAGAFEAACKAGILVVVAAGNDAVDINVSPTYPAWHADEPGWECLLAVASTTSTDTLSSFSNWGPRVKIAAPGSSIYSTYHTSTTATAVLSGTSMATPHVAGAAIALMNEFPTLTALQVKNALVASGTLSPTYSGRTIAGTLMNVSRAYEIASMAANGVRCTAAFCTGTAPICDPATGCVGCAANTTVCTSRGLFCATSGACVACLTAATCPASTTPCKVASCSTAGVCGLTNLANGVACTLAGGAPGKCSAGTCLACGAVTTRCQNNANCCSNKCRAVSGVKRCIA